MKLMVSVFFGEGTFLFRQNKKTQHIFLIWFAFYSARGAENIFFLKKMLLRIWRQHPLCFGDVVSRTERCILYDGRPFDLRTYRLETEAGSKLTQLGLMARCRQIRQQQSFAGINLQSYIAPRKHQRKTFFCTTVLFLGVLKQWFHCWSVGRQGLKRMGCTSINTASCRSKTLHLQHFVHVFFGVRVAKQSSRAKPPPVPKILTCSWRIFSAKKQDQQPQSHTSVWKCTFENTCSYIGSAEQFTHK